MVDAVDELHSRRSFSRLHGGQQGGNNACNLALILSAGAN
jgi:hypothetical protein